MFSRHLAVTLSVIVVNPLCLWDLAFSRFWWWFRVSVALGALNHTETAHLFLCLGSFHSQPLYNRGLMIWQKSDIGINREKP